MSIDQTDVIDSIGIDNLTGTIVLSISDHLEWDNKHLLLLQEKLNTYVGFIESKEILDTYPDARDRDVLIDVICKYLPDQNAKVFLTNVNHIVKKAGINFSYRVL